MVELTAERLRQVLAYDQNTGRFVRRITTCIRLKSGCNAGTVATHRYSRIQIDGVLYSAHRLVWLYVYGVWPSGILDHINGEKTDNRLVNLRPATVSQNKANSKLRHDNASGFKGVYFCPDSKKWCAQIRHHGKLHSLGRFGCPETAHTAYMRRAGELFGEFARAA